MNLAGSGRGVHGSRTVSFGGGIEDYDDSWDLTVNGNASFGGDVGDPVFGLFALNSLTVTGTTTLGPGLSQVHTVGGQTYTGVSCSLRVRRSRARRSPSVARSRTSTNRTTCRSTGTRASGGMWAPPGSGYFALDSLTVTGTALLGPGLSEINTVAGRPSSRGSTLLSDATLTSTSYGNVTFSGPVDGDANLTVSTAGTSPSSAWWAASRRSLSLTIKAGRHDRHQRRRRHDHRHQDYEEPVTLSADATFTSTSDGNLTFAGTVIGPFALDVSTLGVTTFLGAVSVASLTTASFGTTEIDGSGITTTGNISLNNNVTIGSQATINGGGGTTFGGTVTQNQSASGRSTTRRPPR